MLLSRSPWLRAQRRGNRGHGSDTISLPCKVDALVRCEIVKLLVALSSQTVGCTGDVSTYSHHASVLTWMLGLLLQNVNAARILPSSLLPPYSSASALLDDVFWRNAGDGFLCSFFRICIHCQSCNVVYEWGTISAGIVATTYHNEISIINVSTRQASPLGSAVIQMIRLDSSDLHHVESWIQLSRRVMSPFLRFREE